MSELRLGKVRQAMAEKGLDGLVISKPENRAYLSGFTGTSGWLLITPQKAYLVTDFRYTEQAAAQAPAYEVVKQDATVSAQQLIARLCEQERVQKLGYEGDFLTVDDFETYRKLHPGRELVSATGLVEALRMVKEPAEVELMRTAARIADEAWAEILKQIKPGVVERDLAVELEYQMKKRGAEGNAFDFIVASGTRSALPHGVASDKRIEQGDLVTFDFGCVYKGYCSDMTRTVMVGEPTEKQREIYAIVLEAQMRGLAACKPGMTGKELDEVCRSYIREKGYADHFGHGTGHGVGRFIHEGPKVSVRGEQDVLQPGMVVTIEPGIYLPGWGGVRIEDMVLVTEDGCERLSQSPKDLLIL